jgi:hypothetical protein
MSPGRFMVKPEEAATIRQTYREPYLAATDSG